MPRRRHHLPRPHAALLEAARTVERIAAGVPHASDDQARENADAADGAETTPSPDRERDAKGRYT